MNMLKTIIGISVVALSTVAWGIDEHRPIQGGTTNPSPTGPNDRTPIQNEPEDTVDTTTVTPAPAPEPRVRSAKPKTKHQTGSGTSPTSGAGALGGGSSGSTGTGANMQNGSLGGGSSGSTGNGSYTGTPAPKVK